MLLNLGKWTEAELDKLIRMASGLKDPGERISLISEHFLGSKYLPDTLSGSKDQQEELVINLEGLDCFTLLDYVEAMRISCNYNGFRANLIKVRYRDRVVSFVSRNHFFTDWAAYSPSRIRDVTGEIGHSSVKKVEKTLNLRDDGTFYINGIEPVKRTVTFIPSEHADEQVLKSLKTGDYAGIYSDRTGLDVSHVGIIIPRKDGLYLRHASSQKEAGKVIDQDFRSYIKGKPGIIILRPMN